MPPPSGSRRPRGRSGPGRDTTRRPAAPRSRASSGSGSGSGSGSSSAQRAQAARTAGARDAARGSGRTSRQRAAALRRPVPAELPRTRFTGRAAVLVLIVAGLAVSSASYLRAYLDQRAHITDLQASIADHEGVIDALEEEKQQWRDATFIEMRARELGFVNPGETPYVVLRDGQPIEPEGELSDPAAEESTPTPWWEDAWTTVEVAGDPPTRATPPPAARVTDPEGAPDEADGADQE